MRHPIPPPLPPHPFRSQGLTLVDISDPLHPELINRTREFFDFSHNIYLDPFGRKYLYACGMDTYNGASPIALSSLCPFMSRSVLCVARVVSVPFWHSVVLSGCLVGTLPPSLGCCPPVIPNTHPPALALQAACLCSTSPTRATRLWPVPGT